jgi:hypothetical protein
MFVPAKVGDHCSEYTLLMAPAKLNRGTPLLKTRPSFGGAGAATLARK